MKNRIIQQSKSFQLFKKNQDSTDLQKIFTIFIHRI